VTRSAEFLSAFDEGRNASFELLFSGKLPVTILSGKQKRM